MSLTMAKKPKNEAKPQDYVCRWNLLPDDIIDNILSRITLPNCFEIAISPTTVDIKLLSSVIEMSQIWTTLENLVTIFTSPSTTIFRLHLSRIICHKLSFESFINSWTRHLLPRCSNIKHLEITPLGGACCSCKELDPGKIFQTHSLVSLDLDKLGKHGFAWKLPRWINLPNLKKLTLSLIDFRDLGRLIRYCPSLEDLTITFAEVCTGYVIVSTNKLKQLRICVYWFSCLDVIIDAPNLEHLNFGSPRRSFQFGVGGDGDLCMRLVHSLSYVKSLVLDLDAPTRLYNSTDKTNFPNLTHLRLKFGSFERFESIGTMLHCLNLEVVVLKVTDFIWTSLVPDAVPFGLFKHVKRIELSKKVARFNKQLLNLVLYLLKTSPSLETLSLSVNMSMMIRVGRFDIRRSSKLKKFNLY